MFNFFKINRFFENIVGYVDTKLQLYKLEVKEEIEKVLQKFLFIILIVLSTSFFLIFLSVTIAFLINGITGSDYLGFLYVAIFYLLFTIVFFFILKAKNKEKSDFSIKNLLDKEQGRQE